MMMNNRRRIVEPPLPPSCGNCNWFCQRCFEYWTCRSEKRFCKSEARVCPPCFDDLTEAR